MVASQKKWHRLIQSIPGQAYLWLAVLIFGSSGAVTRKVTEIGSQNLINGRNPISLCNVLGETPTQAQYIGGIVILLGIFISQFGIWQQHHPKVTPNGVESAPIQQNIETKVGFKGI